MDHDHAPFVEDPDAFPSWVYQYTSNPEYEHVNNLRGVPVFKVMEESGFHVTGWPMEEPFTVPFRGVWTYIFLMAPPYDDLSEIYDRWECRNVSLIIDCHFPIMDMTRTIAPDDAEYMRLHEHREVMLKNLRLAEAITTPQAKWAADLAQVNPNVFILPDLELDDADPDTVTGEKMMRFQLKFAQASNASMREHTQRHYAKYGTHGEHPHATDG